jgi:hypothetical protein
MGWLNLVWRRMKKMMEVLRMCVVLYVVTTDFCFMHYCYDTGS